MSPAISHSRAIRRCRALHAVLANRPAGWCVQATSATNGLFVNGTRLAAGSLHLLASGDELRFGERTTTIFHTIGGGADDRSHTQTARPGRN